jgi:methionyl-tRNA formyltransferase
MRLIFMGTPDFAVETLEALHKARHDIVLVVTQADKPKGRKGQLQPPPVKTSALSLGIPVYQPKVLRESESIEKFRSYEAECIVVAAYGKILPKEILEMPKYGCINVHASLLPKYRGASPIQWAVINGERTSGITTMRMDEGLDTGDMILQKSLELREDETAGSLFERLAPMGAELCVITLELIENSQAFYTPQNEVEATYTGMIKKEMGRVDFSKPAIEIERLIRGLNPWPGTYTTWQDKTLKIWKSSVEETDSKETHGTITKAEKNQLWIQTGKGQLKIEELQLEGKKRMEISDFLRGNTLMTAGEKFLDERQTKSFVSQP